MFKRLHGGGGYYVGDEQTRFLLINSQRISPQCPANFNDKPAVRARSMELAKTMLRDTFDLVAIIEDLEYQKEAFLEFFEFPTTGAGARQGMVTKDGKGNVAAPASSGDGLTAHLGRAPDPLGHVHKIDYVKAGVTEAEIKKMKANLSNKLDNELYALAKELSSKNPKLGLRRQKDMEEAAVSAKVYKFSEAAKTGAIP